MKNLKQKLLTISFLLASFITIAQVGIGTETPATSAALDITSNDKALLVTRLPSTSVVDNPINGMIIYDMSVNCIKFFEDGAWTDCVSPAKFVSDGDPIRDALTESVGKYDDAEINTHVEITYDEYLAIRDSQYMTTYGYFGEVSPEFITTNFRRMNWSDKTHHGMSAKGGTTHNNRFKSLPDNNYVVAVARAQDVGTSSFQITVTDNDGTSNVKCLTDYGAPIWYAKEKFYYFAIKKPTTHSGTGKDFVGDKHTNGGAHFIQGAPNAGSMRYGTADCGANGYRDIMGGNNSPALQVIGTTLKRW